MQRHGFNRTRWSAALGVGVLAAGAGLVACGGGGNPSGPGSAKGSVSIAPEGLTLSVGGAGNLTADARDSSGTALPAVLITWSSLNSSVASVDQDGKVNGEAVGTTKVLAEAGGVADTVVVVVVDLPCNAIELVPQWHANVIYFYEDGGRVQPSADVHTFDFAVVAATLTPVGPPVGGIVEWSGPLVAGVTASEEPQDTAVSIDEESSDLTSDPTIVATVRGVGNPVSTPGVDGMRLQVNLSSCTYRFITAPSVHATLTVTEHAVNTLPGPDEGTRSFDMDIPLGLLQSRFGLLGDWRADSLGHWPGISSFPSYSVLYTPANADSYTPSGEFGQLLFGDPPSSAPRADHNKGDADVLSRFVPEWP